MSLVPFTAKDCVVCIYYYYVKRQVVNVEAVDSWPLFKPETTIITRTKYFHFEGNLHMITANDSLY